MRYFSMFPTFHHYGTEIRDIFRHTGLTKRIKELGVYYEKYVIKDGELPEDVANKAYGDPELHWVVLMVNDIVNPWHEWPVSVREIGYIIEQKYGAGKEYLIHHYETNDQSDLGAGHIVNSSYTPTFARDPITNLAYEEALNEYKRHIKLLRREFIPIVIEEQRKKIQL